MYGGKKVNLNGPSRNGNPLKADQREDRPDEDLR